MTTQLKTTKSKHMIKPPKIILGMEEKPRFDYKRTFFLLLGVVLFLVINYSPAWPDAIDPQGQAFVLTPQGKGALGLFLLAATWWIFEVLPIGITSIVIGVVQVLFFIRPANEALKDFMDPSVWFIFASIVIGLAFSRTGLTKRMAYNVLGLVGERTSMIYLGCFGMVALLTLIMAHTAVAAASFPLLMTIYSLYDPENKQTKFGKGLFIGMAYVAGAGSIITLLGSARAAVAIGFFKQMAGREIGFFELTYYLAPVGLSMVAIIWLSAVLFFKPEQSRIPGLMDRVAILKRNLGPMSKNEILTLILVFSAILVLSLQSFVPAFHSLHKSAVLLLTTIGFFILKILDVKDLEEIPWNIILLFGGAMCIGYCLWDSGAAKWLAVNWLSMFKDAHWFIFVMAISLFVLVMTNLIMNVAAISIVLPVALVIAQYLGVSPEVIFYSSLVTAGMPFILLVGAAPNAIAYESKQFSSGEFLKSGVPMSIMLLIVLAVFVTVIWPIMGMPVLGK